MTKREITSILIKLMGIYCIVQFVPSLIVVLGYLTMMRDSPHLLTNLFTLAFMFAGPGIWIGFCVLVIRKSGSIAKRLYNQDSECNKLTALGFSDVQTLGYSFIGLIILVQSFPQIISLLITIKAQYIHLSQYTAQERFYLNTLPRLLCFLTQFILGLILFLYPKGLVNLWKKVQVMRYEKRNTENQSIQKTKDPAPKTEF